MEHKLEYLLLMFILLTGLPQTAAALVNSDTGHNAFQQRLGISEPTAFPEVGLLRTKVGACLGTLVSPHTIVSSAVCFDPTGVFIDEVGSSSVSCATVGSLNTKIRDSLKNELMLCRLQGSPREAFALIDDQSPESILVISRACDSGIERLGSNILPVATGALQLRAFGVACPGDQGAPAFILPTEENERLRLIGVLKGASANDGTISFATLNTAQRSIELGSTAEQLNVTICGFSSEVEECDTPRSILDGRAELVLSETVSVAYSAGDTLTSLATKLCQFLTPAYLETLTASYQDATLRHLTEPWNESGTIGLPVCPKGAEVEVRVVKAGDSPLRYFDRDPDKFGFEESGPADGSKPGSFMAAFVALNPDYSSVLFIGDDVKLPRVTGSSQQKQYGDVVTEPRVTLIASRPSSDPGYECSPGISGDSIFPPFNNLNPLFYPFNVFDLIGALHENRYRYMSSVLPATVLVADTGIFMPAGQILSQQYFKEIRADDPDAAPSNPSTHNRDVSHGTQVASMALGGPTFARIWSITNDRRLIVNSKRVLDLSSLGDFVAQQAALYSVASSSAHIVNLSVAGPRMEEFRAIADERDSDWPLFVVAAGNEGGNFMEGGLRVYPAALGGETRRNLIVVAMQDGPRNFLHPFSSFDQYRADIAAPGCSVQVLSWRSGGYVTELSSGTSISAPIVSFTAALIYNEGKDNTAQKIKRRILVSADLNPSPMPQALHLASTVRDGRRLNILKAVRLHEDLIEVPGDFIGDPSRLIQGEVKFKMNGSFLESGETVNFTGCANGVSRDIPSGFIYKLWPFEADDKRKVRIYYRRNREEPSLDEPVFEVDACDIREDLVLSIISSAGSEEFDLPSIVDYVARSKWF